MPLQLTTRHLGETVLVECSGRIAAGDAVETLQAEVKHLMRHPHHLVLNLGDVSFLDSSGLGALVRLQVSTRAAGRNLCLCCVPDMVRKTLKLTNVLSLFPTFDTETDAIRAVHTALQSKDGSRESSGPPVLCLEESADVRAYLGELLRRAGYWPLVSSSLHDALLLQKALRPKTIVLGSERLTAHGRPAREALVQVDPSVRVIELEAGFCQQDAGEAGERLLQALRSSQ